MLKNPDNLLPILEDFFQLNLLNLQVEYESWKQKDSNFKLKSVKLDGLRMLRQDPLENCFSFICSSNNNVKRITKMVINYINNKFIINIF
jgi:N-glycosylase/DNA lyase